MVQTGVGILIQARVSSTRLPGKALLPLPLGGDVTLFEQALRRARRATLVAEVAVAMPDSPADEPLALLCQRASVRCFRGSETDVLARFHGAAQAFGFQHVVRLTADNPALDPAFIDEAVRAHLAGEADYTITEGLPLGMNVEVIRAAALALACHEAVDPAEREHVTPFVRRRPERFRLQTVPIGGYDSSLRLTVDYPTDYAFQQLLYTALGSAFQLADVGALLARYPWLAEVNSANQQLRV